MSHANYLTRAFEPDYIVREYQKQVLDKGYKPEVLVGTGLSGTLALAALRTKLGVDIAIVRKDGERNHSGYDVESTIYVEERTWIFVDDLISSGNTRDKVIKAMKRHHPGAFLGTFLYNPHDGAISEAGQFRPAHKDWSLPDAVLK